ncbi:monooxygenase [Pigmentiphaga litoralis]|uniref:FAD-dependent oxidoreductase n=1 Tax=Pigmentiphaga litoralis TaxID=516702 RepID=UPI00167A1C55|nr:FAD-dependent oxidoreductase [Pigmentiphaga litoralis]GGX17622.1 monooxygenase [Pigmentiphaga litoralis]
MAHTIETSVLIVGAGPAGLALALDLGWRGIDCIVIDQQDEISTLPRAAGLTWRTMEFCRRWGIADRVYHAGFPRDYRMDIVYCTSLTGHELEREQYEPLGGRAAPPFSPQDRERCPQLLFDPLLEKAALEHPSVSIRRLHRLESFEETDGGVIAYVRNLKQNHAHDFTGDRPETLGIGRPETIDDTMTVIHADYMVACDGVDSSVRNALGIGLDGTPLLNYTISLLIHSPWLQRHHDMGEGERYMLVGPTGIWGNLTVVDGRNEWRLSLTGSAQKIDLENTDTSAIVRRCLGRDDIPFEVKALSPWRRREVVASQLRHGRIFIAGDAAHAMSPTGGFGMNTSLQDVVDLGWKLEAVLTGWGGEHLLDTYDLERRPVGKWFVSAATSLFRPWLLKLDYSKILDSTPDGEATRCEVGKTLKEVMLPEWEIAGTAMGYRYEDSPICVPDGTPPPDADPVNYVQTSRPGSRAPHAWLGDGRSTLDLFGRGFVLLRFGGADLDVSRLEAAATRRGMPLHVVDIADDTIAALYERRLTLVRPDGHSAWRGDSLPEDPQALIDVVRGARRPRTHSVSAVDTDQTALAPL